MKANPSSERIRDTYTVADITDRDLVESVDELDDKDVTAALCKRVEVIISISSQEDFDLLWLTFVDDCPNTIDGIQVYDIKKALLLHFIAINDVGKIKEFGEEVSLLEDGEVIQAYRKKMTSSQKKE
jgi:hypothetical protein